MKLLSIVFAEMLFRWKTSLLAAAGIAVTVAASLSLLGIHSAAQRETIRVQRDMGFNLRIISKEAKPERFLIDGYTEKTITDDTLTTLSEQKALAYNHLVGMLQGRIELDGLSVLLTGLSPTRFPPGKKKPLMSPTIEPKTAHVGHLVAQRLALKKGDSLPIHRQDFLVARVAPEEGDENDVRVWVHLEDAQQLLDRAGQINEIRAIDCLCMAPDDSPETKLREVIGKIAPHTQVVMLTKIASARARQRRMMAKLVAYGVPAMIAAGAILIAVLSFLNARERRRELGVLRSLGFRSEAIGVLLLLKAALLGFMGGVVGAAAAVWIVHAAAPQLAIVTGKTFQFDREVVVCGCLLAPLMTCLASLLATTWAVTQRPVDLLRES